MSYKIIPTEYFMQQARELKKVYPNIRRDLKELADMLNQNPKAGTPLGRKVYKIRVKNSDLRKGKSGGYRVITYVMDDIENIRLLTIYAKPRKATISNKEIMAILKSEGIV